MKHIFIVILFLGILLLCLFQDNETMVEIFKNELIPPHYSGKVTDMEIIKGGALTLEITDTLDNVSHLPVTGIIQKIVKKRDHLEKIQNSNQCILHRKDSVMYLDCFEIDSIDRESLGEIKEWPEEMKNKWIYQKADSR